MNVWLLHEEIYMFLMKQNCTALSNFKRRLNSSRREVIKKEESLRARLNNLHSIRD